MRDNRSVHGVVSFAGYQCLAQPSTQVGHDSATYGTWLCQVDYDSDNSRDEATTSSRSSSPREVQSLDVDGGNNPVMFVVGSKRRGDGSLVRSVPAKRPKYETARVVNDHRR